MATIKLGSKADAFHLDGHTWVCNSELPSDIIIEIGEFSFQLHKFPMLNRSGLFKKLISEYRNENGKVCRLQLHDLPAGAKIFELVAKFCYDVKIELNSYNVAALRCAAEYLCMTEDYFEGNLISKTENFLIEIFGDWKDSIKVLKSCEDLLPLAEELHIVTRCINSLALKACADPNTFVWPTSARSSVKSSDGNSLWNGISSAEKKKATELDWWYEESSCLSLALYKRLIVSMGSKGMKPENIAGSLIFYLKKYFRGLSRNSSFQDGNTRANHAPTLSPLSESEQRAVLEELVGLLPSEKGLISTTFLLHLLRTAMILHADNACREDLERRIGAQLDEASLEDLLMPNLGYSVETLYDIDSVHRMVDHFVSINPTVLAGSPAIVDEAQLMESSTSSAPITKVAKLVDGYLAEVAPDHNLKFPKFQSLAALIPEYARNLHDGLYRAIDIFLKAHPWLTDSEREQLCRLMNCQKLSLEACTHAAQNERLPLRFVVQVLFFEQLRLRTSVAGWFFVSENMENIDGSNRSLIIPKSSERICENEIMEEEKDDVPLIRTDEVRQRVAELEKECVRMRKEIQKIGNSKPKSGWSSFCKRFPWLGFGARS
ncbi:BTB/POZ domain-containing protein At5g03250-like [Phalaenopsis equestris]|uniref:BTB/POZ domain-containing protein At5g03250-like n=1 Tax=Phalaenopsis equestris TaxID=78828 RepID=UPI0009E6447A|nr:BTB/POZ domain-containing protein At5g03250-like [Phalaenopsis equestris]